jgi:LysW-gamma-L-lysine carboxypeptidase
VNADVELLRSLVATPSVSGDEGAASELLVRHMAGCGFDARVDEVGNAVGLRSGGPAPDGAPQRSLVLLGHVDTVPGLIPVRLEDGVLHGRGSVDAKGPLATFTRAVASVEPLPGVDLIVIGAVEEEAASSRGARHVVDKFAPQACIIGEPSGWDAVTLGYKGCLRLALEFEAPVGHSAGPLPPVAEAAAELWQTLKLWCADFNAGRPQLFDQVLPSLQEFVTRTDGLHEQARLRIGFRLPPDFDPSWLEAVVREAAPDTPHEFHGHELAWSSAAGSSLVRCLRRAILEAGGRAALKRKTGTSDMNVVGPVWGCPIVAYGPGDSSLDHTPGEHLVLEEYERAIAVLRAALVLGGWAR